MIAALLVYGTVLIVYVSNTNGNSKATLIRTPQAGDNYGISSFHACMRVFYVCILVYPLLSAFPIMCGRVCATVSQLSRNNMFGELSFGSKQRSVKTFREHHGGKIGSDLDPVTSAPDEYVDVLAGEDSQEKNEEIINDEDNDLDERDFGFLTRGWEKQEGKSCTGLAHDDMEVRSLHLSKLMCASNDACHCIECERTSSGRNPQRCTLRAASQTGSSGSSDCYTRTDSRDGHGTHPVVPHPSKHRLRTRDDVVQLPRMVADREWKKHDAASCHGFANGDALSRDLEASKLACKENKYCYGIECERTFELNPKDCTLRSQVKEALG